MAELLLLAANIAITFGIGLAAAYALGKIRAMFHEMEPYVGCRVRIRGRSQIYRCRLESIKGNRWTLGPPLVRDEFYPLVKGEKVIGEVVLDSGTLLFRTEVAFADDFKGRVWIKIPKRTFWKPYGQLAFEPGRTEEAAGKRSMARI